MKHLEKLEIPTKEDMRATRVLLGLTMSEVANETNVLVSTIHRLETGKSVLFSAWVELVSFYNSLIKKNKDHE